MKKGRGENCIKNVLKCYNGPAVATARYNLNNLLGVRGSVPRPVQHGNYGDLLHAEGHQGRRGLPGQPRSG